MIQGFNIIPVEIPDVFINGNWQTYSKIYVDVKDPRTAKAIQKRNLKDFHS